MILMDDFNAKIGSDNRRYKEITGQQYLGERNDNGEIFADMFSANNLVNRGKCFQSQNDTQVNLGVTRPVNGEPDRPPVHRKEVLSLL
ncbi:hypothetical protein DPMN_044922 [Dreissena polymorpha]|uniref:Uncharacterized protein n=1 Tax=Dreissena polymorpha TaxID=45954 RepID=A0A9D4D5E8_DREPO|nr:hypothetical protein DPMN_044922 [Dreissena polymorpha]